MKFLLLTLIVHADRSKSPARRLREVVDTAVLAEELGYDGFAVGERHERPFISSAPPVVLSHIAARTSRLRLWTGVTTLSLLDPVRAFEDYSTLDNLSDGRLELIIGKGNGTAQAQLFHVTPDDQWDRNREGYELFRRLWREPKVTWEGRFRPSLTDAETWPRPYQPEITIWHGSATSRESVAHTSQEAIDTYRPIFSARVATFRAVGVEPVFPTLEDAIERSSILVGSPQQVIDKIGRYHQRFGHEVMHLHADGDGLTDKQHRATLELFQSEVAPAVRPWEGR